MLDDFEPSAWRRLPDSQTTRILLTDGSRTLVAVLVDPDRAAAAEAERVATATLRSAVPSEFPRMPKVLGSRTLSGEPYGFDAPVSVMLCEAMPGAPLSTDMFEERPALISSLARCLASLHSADPGPLADAGLVVHDSAEIRSGLLDDLDAAAETGRVPSGLLGRWETALETVDSWRFPASPVHSGLGPDALWADGDAIVGLSDLSRVRVGDPAADIAAVSSMLRPEDFEAFFREYRRCRPGADPGLRRRVEIRSELVVLEWLLAARAAHDSAAEDDAVRLLTALAEVTGAADADESASEETPGSRPDDAEAPSTAARPSASGAAEDAAPDRADSADPDSDGVDSDDDFAPAPARSADSAQAGRSAGAAEGDLRDPDDEDGEDESADRPEPASASRTSPHESAGSRAQTAPPADRFTPASFDADDVDEDAVPTELIDLDEDDRRA